MITLPPTAVKELESHQWQEWFRQVRDWLLNFPLTRSITVGVAGVAQALPANPEGYLDVYLKGAHYKVPYYLP